MSSCETSDAEGPVPVNSAAVLRKSQPAGGSPCRGHVLRKAKVSLPSRSGDTCPEACQPPWEGRGRIHVLSPESPLSQPPSGASFAKAESPEPHCQARPSWWQDQQWLWACLGSPCCSADWTR